MDSTSTKTLLTIAIPTYNRAAYLDLCLNHICRQIQEHDTGIEILISDNNSSDHTGDVVQRYIAKGYPVIYLKNHNNIGPDRNFIQCFRLAKGKYVLIMGDDDILLDRAIETIIKIIKKGEYGIIHMNAYGFKEDYIKEKPRTYYNSHTVYKNTLKYLNVVNYFVTFISANIINKELADNNIDFEQYIGSNLIQLSWTLSGLFNAKENVYIRDHLVAARMFNSNYGYYLCGTFAVNLNKVFDIYIKQGIPKHYFNIITNKLLMKYFPAQIIRTKMNMMKYIEEDYYHILYPLYKYYINFWIFTVPAILLPKKIAFFILSITDTCRRILWFLKSIPDSLR